MVNFMIDHQPFINYPLCMTDTANNISTKKISLSDKFQEKVLSHWTEIKGSQCLPKTKDFRPQLFGGDMKRLALFQRDKAKQEMRGRVIGSAISTAFHMPDDSNTIGAIPDITIREHISSLFQDTVNLTEPSVIIHDVIPDKFYPIKYSVLCLPFNEQLHAPDEPCDPNAVLYAFSFKSRVKEASKSQF